jgi:malonate-semialdehyde dehydrogenase (acetylating)/methylmalonate-semialdehyde dehydrogenase
MTTSIATPPTNDVAQLKILRGGKWETSSSSRHGEVFNPSTGKVIARVPLCDAAETSSVIETAAEALPAWAATPVVERVRVLFKFRELMLRDFDKMAQTVSREHGKTPAEARASVHRGIEVVEFACGIPSLLMGEVLPNLAHDVDAETVRHPVGVCVGITPFNFPAMVPLWMFPVALACGNTFVLKPSEKVPLSAMLLGELLTEAGCPDGVFNIVHGDKECVDTLLTHPKVRAISFVGSTNIARYVYQTGTQHGKRVQAAGGAKNHLIVMPDADLDQAAAAIQASAFGCAGERCMAGSVAVPVGGVADALVERVVERASKMTVGPTDVVGSKADVGPLISAAHRDKVASYIDIGAKEGASVALDGRKDLPKDGFFLRPSVIDKVACGTRLATEEIFGPVLSVVRAGDIKEAIAIGKSCKLGNGASIFTSSGHAAREFKQHFNAGMIGINIGVPAPMAWFPFTGWNDSFFGDLHIQGRESIQFYTQGKTTMTRWFASKESAAHDPVWRQK